MKDIKFTNYTGNVQAIIDAEPNIEGTTAEKLRWLADGFHQGTGKYIYLNNRRISNVTMNVLIVAGQSNSDGWALQNDENAPEWIGDPIPIKVWDGHEILPEYNLAETGPGAGKNGRDYTERFDVTAKYGFSDIVLHDMAAKFAEDLVMIRVSAGSACLVKPAETFIYGSFNTDYDAVDWPADTPKLYEALKERILGFIAYCHTNGIVPVFQGLVWHQGERDARMYRADEYRNEFEALVADIRSITETPDLPVFYGTPSVRYMEGTDPLYEIPEVRAAQMEMADENAGFYCIDSYYGIPDSAVDKAHFQAISCSKMAKWIVDLWSLLLDGDYDEETIKHYGRATQPFVHTLDADPEEGDVEYMTGSVPDIDITDELIKLLKGDLVGTLQLSESIINGVGFAGSNKSGLIITDDKIARLFDLVHNSLSAANGYDYLQTDSGKMPALADGSIVFDNTDDALSASGEGLNVMKAVSGATVFVVRKMTDAPSAGQIKQMWAATLNASTSVRLGIAAGSSTGGKTFTSSRRKDTDALVQALGSDTDTNKVLITVRANYASPEMAIWNNGNLINRDTTCAGWSTAGSPVTTDDAASQAVNIGYTAYAANAAIDFVMVVKAALSDADREKIEQWIMSKWGVA